MCLLKNNQNYLSVARITLHTQVTPKSLLHRHIVATVSPPSLQINFPEHPFYSIPIISHDNKIKMLYRHSCNSFLINYTDQVVTQNCSCHILSSLDFPCITLHDPHPPSPSHISLSLFLAQFK